MFNPFKKLGQPKIEDPIAEEPKKKESTTGENPAIPSSDSQHDSESAISPKKSIEEQMRESFKKGFGSYVENSNYSEEIKKFLSNLIKNNAFFYSAAFRFYKDSLENHKIGDKVDFNKIYEGIIRNLLEKKSNASFLKTTAYSQQADKRKKAFEDMIEKVNELNKKIQERIPSKEEKAEMNEVEKSAMYQVFQQYYEEANKLLQSDDVKSSPITQKYIKKYILGRLEEEHPALVKSKIREIEKLEYSEDLEVFLADFGIIIKNLAEEVKEIEEKIKAGDYEEKDAKKLREEINSLTQKTKEVKEKLKEELHKFSYREKNQEKIDAIENKFLKLDEFEKGEWLELLDRMYKVEAEILREIY